MCAGCTGGVGTLDPGPGLGLRMAMALGLALGLGLGRGEEVEGAPAAGLLALSLAESLSDCAAQLGPSGGWLIFIFLQLGRTRYFSGRGPFLRTVENLFRKSYIHITAW